MPTETAAVGRARLIAEAGETFLSAVLSGQASADDTDDWVEVWHNNPHLHADTSLEDFLGLNWTEYANWVRDPDAIHEIVEQRRNGS